MKIIELNSSNLIRLIVDVGVLHPPTWDYAHLIDNGSVAKTPKMAKSIQKFKTEP